MDLDTDKPIASSLNTFFQYFFNTTVAKIKSLDVAKTKEKVLEYSELFTSKETFRCDLSQVTRSESFRNPSTISRSQSFRSQSNHPSRRPSAMYFNKLSVSDFPRNSRRDNGDDSFSLTNTRRASVIISNKLSVSGFPKLLDVAKSDHAETTTSTITADSGAVLRTKPEFLVSDISESVLR